MADLVKAVYTQLTTPCSRKEAMLGTLARIRAQYGSIERCVVDLGILTPEGITQLRNNLIVEADEDEVVRWQDHVSFML